jgi:hypothetical protein
MSSWHWCLINEILGKILITSYVLELLYKQETSHKLGIISQFTLLSTNLVLELKALSLQQPLVVYLEFSLSSACTHCIQYLLSVKKYKVNFSLFLINQSLCHEDVGGEGSTASPLLTSIDIDKRSSSHLYCNYSYGKGPLEAGWAPMTTCSLCRGKKSLAPARN